MRIPAEFVDAVIGLYVFTCEQVDGITRKDENGVPIIGGGVEGDTKVAAAILTGAILRCAQVQNTHNIERLAQTEEDGDDDSRSQLG